VIEVARSLSEILIGALASFIALVVVSYVIERSRPVPKQPERLAWAPGVLIQHTDIGGIKVRHIRTGAGPNLVLLHTLRTQLDVLEKIIPNLANRFTVYACDHPGHGWSDIPEASYGPEDFYKWTAAFLEAIDIRQAAVAGISIGGTIALVLAARQNPRVAKVISINPYDYWPAGGIRQSSLTARLVLTCSEVPVFGPTMMRLRNRFVSDRIFEGGVASRSALPRNLAHEFYQVGARPGHYQSFLRLLAHERLWPESRREYPSIRVPVLLVYGDEDWAPDRERARTRSLIPGVVAETIRNGSHFLSLDRPRELCALIDRFVDS
jgi:pimeloyl-ACP methyl ester carboxylesterase